MKQFPGRFAAGVVATLLVVGCGASGGSAPASPAGASDPTVTSAPAPTEGAATSRPRLHGGATAAPAESGAAEQPDSDAGSAAPDSGGSSGNGDARAIPLIPAGDYLYHVHATTSTAFGDREVDGDSHLVVSEPSGNRQHTEMSGKDGRTEQTVVARPDGLYLVDLEMDQDGFSAEFRPESPVLLFPADPRRGQEWSWDMTSTDGEYDLHATLRLSDTAGTERVAGERVETVTVSSVLRITGDTMSVTVHQEDEANHDGLIVREHSVGDGTAYGTKFHTDATRRLTS